MSRVGGNLGLPDWRLRRIDTQTAFLAIICLFVVIVHFWAPTGFAGWDDWHYFQAAQRWIADGPHVPTDHWAARLPHVLMLAGMMRVSSNELWLLLPGLAMFAVALWCGSRLAGMAMGSEAAIAATGMIAFAPLLFRQASSFYPEGMEVACSAVAILLAFTAAQDASERRSQRTLQLLCAGAIGGVAVLVRQTALAVPMALALFLLIKQRSDPRRALQSVATFGLGAALVVGIELAFYAHLIGDPLHRFAIDRRTLTIPSVHLKGGVFLESPLFNWKLAALWDVPESFSVHWTINPILNLLFSPQVLLVPWLALGGFAMARRGPQPLKDLAFLTTLILALQYFSFTYAIVLPPSIRYYSISIFMLCVMAGVFVATRDQRLRAILLLCVIAAAIFIASIQRSYPRVVASMRSLTSPSETVYASDVAANRLAWALSSDRAFAERVRLGEAPIGAQALFTYEDTSGLKRICANGEPAWQTSRTLTRPTIFWSAGESLGLARLVPSGVASKLRRDTEIVVLARRRC